MKQINKILFVLILFAAVFFSGCSKYTLYKMAIDSRRGSADLVVRNTTTSAGKIVYLDNEPEKLEKPGQDVILMVHGFGANKDNWLMLSKEMTDDYRIIALDLPGHGESNYDQSLQYTIENQATWLSEFLEKLEVKKVHLIGNSMGGGISLKLTRLYPEKVLSLTLLDSGGVYKTDSEYIKLLKKGINPLIISTPDEYMALMDFVMEKRPYIPGAFIEVLTEKKIARKALDEKIFQDIIQDLRNMETILSDIKTPTLIVWGEKDRVLHVDSAEVFHQKIKGSRKEILEGVGHIPMIEVPEETGAIWKKFISSL